MRTALPNTRAVLERNECGTPLSTYVVVASTCCHRRSLLIATGNLRESVIGLKIEKPGPRWGDITLHRYECSNSELPAYAAVARPY